jgi:Tfp pilus assembly protein PilN
MNTPQLLLAEIRYRKLNFALSLLAVVAAVALFVAGPALVDGYSRETQARVAQLEKQTSAKLSELDDQTRRLMLGMGFNLMIVHRDTNMSDLWASDFAVADMPQSYVDRLSADHRVTLITHLVATLQGRISWENRKVLLAGYQPEVTQSHLHHPKPMGYTIAPGTVFVGFELAQGRKLGGSIEIAGRKFRIARLMPEQGSKEDITLAVNLADAQAILDKPGRVNQIMAIGCNCAGSNLPNIRRQLAAILPDTRVTEFHTIALARAEERTAVAEQQAKIVAELAQSRAQVQRQLETLAGVLAPLVVFACAVWVGLLALANVRERRAEIGLLRAIGKGSATIASLFLGKALLVGFLGAVAGFALGAWLAHLLGAKTLDLAAGQVTVRLPILLYALLGAPLVAVIASYLPTLSALTEDPAVVLREL